MNEMEFSIQQTKLEQDAKIKIAEIEADAKVRAAKASKRPRDIWWNGVLWWGAVFVFLLSAAGIVTHIVVNNNNHKAEQIARCEQAGGTWTPRLQRVYVGHSNEQDEWYEICVK